MIASALKKLSDKHVHFRRRVSVEEQRVQKHDRFLRGRQIAYMICEYVHATRAYETVQGLADLFNKSLERDDVQDFHIRWDQALLSSSEIPSECDPGRIVRAKITGRLFSFRLSWLCTIKKLLDTMDKHIIYD